uniref:uncharacterized protein LOC131111058 isoform X1 n=1 Tax=Doryrhamphus excisus TaxID=161450 RepID=UPI0025AE7912|nr:uncharacterized protein LOC131111058 isoform X1 [Doryrhamphus excisus]XP_057920015.1 uncharacterized protein LOC131111058 isoform X1 [Doryrhamphus excisus]XP_057920016.1 uncharacterized protein LOC131111058 isoform X1 [Doryrhamphus excisus]XP_057920018.1 uncharacterized protein LOC131111058 isoform X1 [Doryrhamphus excisus]XP_057920019.1 uncharacterized protein LOC131111058 isoform X1 [Doryrhamphus excisus]
MEQQNESDQPQKLYDTRSVASKTKTSRSSRSSTSSAATKARASAEAALVEAKYAAREAEMMKVKAKIEAEAAQRKAELEASLYVLKIERSATAAAAEAAVYEGAAAVEGSSLEDLAQIPPEDTAQHTSEYVKAHYVTPDAQQPAPVPQQPLTTSTPAPRASLPAPPSSVQWYPLPGTVTNQPTTFVNGEVMFDYNQNRSSHCPPAPVSHTASLRDYPCEPAQMTDLTKHLVRRELVSSGLLKFDDCPEYYWAWKTSFEDVIRGLNLTAREELDLLLRWLGPESSTQAMRIRSAHVHNITAGVALVWERLDDNYGSPEVIENALLSKLENFPKISNKDNQRLRELGDILLEIQAAKAEGYLPGLAYLDTARGVNPIVEKLPYGLQERWISLRSMYKE